MEKKRDGWMDDQRVNQPSICVLYLSLLFSLVLHSSAPHGPVTLCSASWDPCPAQPSCQLLSSPVDLGVGLGQRGTMCLCLSVDSFEMATIPPLLVLLTWTRTAAMNRTFCHRPETTSQEDSCTTTAPQQPQQQPTIKQEVVAGSLTWAAESSSHGYSLKKNTKQRPTPSSCVAITLLSGCLTCSLCHIGLCFCFLLSTFFLLFFSFLLLGQSL